MDLACRRSQQLFADYPGLWPIVVGLKYGVARDALQDIAVKHLRPRKSSPGSSPCSTPQATQLAKQLTPPLELTTTQLYAILQEFVQWLADAAHPPPVPVLPREPRRLLELWGWHFGQGTSHLLGPVPFLAKIGVLKSCAVEERQSVPGGKTGKTKDKIRLGKIQTKYRLESQAAVENALQKVGNVHETQGSR